MPKRMVDGEALWTSSKLKKVFPVEWRAHYANWLPLAEANGIFEADLDIIRARIYPVINPKFTSETVRAIFNEFVRVGLITWFRGEDKVYGYFIGIDKSGRLPADKHMKRYKNLPPDCPMDRLGINPGPIPEESEENPRGFGLDWSGSERVREGLGAPSSALKTLVETE
jgi:hypothetical protein